MKKLLSKTIENNKADLILEDNGTISILVDNEKIENLGGTTYSLVQSDSWVKQALLQSCVQNHLYKKQSRAEMEELAKLYF